MKALSQSVPETDWTLSHRLFAYAPSAYMADPDRRDTTTILSDEAIDWLVRLHSGRANASDRLQLQAWRERSPAHEAAFREAEALWDRLGDVSCPPSVSPEVTKRRARRRVWTIAASILVLAGSLWYGGMLELLRTHLADYRTGIGQRQTVTLADGSTIHLNTNTALSVAFSPQGREVELLDGEAFFVVAPDAARPFTVTIQGVAVRALGTQFDVYRHAGMTTISVLEHAVQVTAPGSNGSRTVSEAHQVTYSAAAGLSQSEVFDPGTAMAWRRGKLIVESQPLGTVIAELDRYRRGKIMILQPKLQGLNVTGVFDVTKPDVELQFIARTLHLHMTHLTPYLILLHS